VFWGVGCVVGFVCVLGGVGVGGLCGGVGTGALCTGFTLVEYKLK